MPSTEKKPIKTKKATVKPVKEAAVESAKPRKYFEATGRRKTSIARSRIFKGDGKITVNDKDYKDYFFLKKYQIVVRSPLEALNIAENFSATVKVLGGGITGQAEAVRHSLSRALVKLNPNYKKRLRKAEYLTRDPRAVERKKYGLKKARRAPQWAKR